MSKRDEFLLLKDILDAANKIIKFTEGMNFQKFIEDDKTQDACIRNFEIMGEAARHISEETMLGNPEIEWRKISNYRNLLIHEYFGVNIEIVWDIIETELDDTIYLLDRILEETSGKA
jgi:uncharacterized protein with HEPN domain